MKPTPLGLCLLVGLSATLPLLAQGQPMARVRGQVTDTSHEALPGVSVSLASAQLQGRRTLVTDSNGIYNGPPVLPGEYQITFQLEGFQAVTHLVRLGASMNVTVNAQLGLGTVAEGIVVTGEAEETTLKSFNPFTETPVKGVNWRKGDKFGQPEFLQRERNPSITAGIRFNP